MRPRSQLGRSRVRRIAELGRHPVARNAASLYAAQAARFAIPVALVPFLARILRPEAFGRLAAAQSLAAMLAILSEFGFAVTATRDVARVRSSPGALSEIAAGVLGAKLVLASLVVAAGAALLIAVPSLASHPSFLWGACLVALGQGAAPTWFFQGTERLGLPTAVDLCGSGVAVVAVFACVRRPEQAAWVLYFSGAAAILASLANHLRMYKEVKFKIPSWRSTATMLRRSVAIFTIRASTALYTTANVFLLGLFMPAAAVADFAGSEKIVRVAVTGFFPANQALFPRIAQIAGVDRALALRYAVRVVAVAAAAAALGAAAIFAAAPWIVRVALGPGYGPAVHLLRWFSGLIPLIAATSATCTLALFPIGRDWNVNALGIAGAAVDILAIVTLVPRYGALGMVWAQLASEGAALAAALFFLSRAWAALPRGLAASAGGREE